MAPITWDELTVLVKQDCLGYPNNIGELDELVDSAEVWFRKCQRCFTNQNLIWDAQKVASNGRECVARLHDYNTALEEWQSDFATRKRHFDAIDDVIRAKKVESDGLARKVGDLNSEVQRK